MQSLHSMLVSLMKEKTTGYARNIFSESGFTYSDIGSKEIAHLRVLLEEELNSFQNGEFKMSLAKVKLYDMLKDDGSIKRCFFQVNSSYFKNREAISFNENGFIGFAGWADSTNVQPFINAFEKWIKIMKLKHHERMH